MTATLDRLVGESHLLAGETERAAAEYVTPKVPAQAKRILTEIATSKGLAGWEIVERTGFLRGSVSRSLTQLSKAEPPYIKSTGKRKDKQGADAQVWVATDAGIEALDGLRGDTPSVPEEAVSTLHPLHESNAFKKAQRLEALVRTLHANLRIPVSPQEYARGFTQNIWDALGRVLKEERNPQTSISICLSLLGEERAA